LAETGIATLLIDSCHQSPSGGTGITVNGAIFTAIQQSVNIPVIMAGGLTSNNVGMKIEKYRPYAVDVLTGVEVKPGQKDAECLHQGMSKKCRHL
jgi:phosphoribosylanthranilate isomerase